MLQEDVVLALVYQVRAKLPRLGGRKLYHMTQSDMEANGLKIGRDRFFSILRDNGLLIKQRRNKMRTTHSYKWFNRYDNLVKGFEPTAPEQLWVSDITYVRTEAGFKYLSLITDAFSRRIVGYHLADDLGRAGCISALRMALNGARDTQGLIHHSDRGSQYCSDEYTTMLTDNGARISMAQQYQPLDNPIAERINGIVKGEFLETQVLKDLQDTREAVKVAVSKYNALRPHLSLNMETPNQIHFLLDNQQQDNLQLVNL